MKKGEKTMKTYKFRKLENPMETITINGVEVVPDAVYDVEEVVKKKMKSLKEKFPNAIVVGGN
tara:strand:- start:335 stop:523 length:189 start_codon:yes stop_codon:yes gene_type:complete